MLILNKNILEKLIGLICSNNAKCNGFLSNQDSLSQQSFLQKKRNQENNYIIQKYENIHSPNKNNNDQIKYYSDCYGENHLFSSNLINLEFNDVKKFKFGDQSNYYNFTENNNIIKQNFINNTICNKQFNLREEHYNQNSTKKYFFENIKEDINKTNNIHYKNIKDNLNDNNNTKDSFRFNRSKNALSNKNTNFEVTRAKEKKQLKKLPNKKIIPNENNNEIKV